MVSITFKPFYEGAKIDELFEELWELFSSGEPWKVADQAVETLKTLLAGIIAWRSFPIMIRDFVQFLKT